MIALLSAVMIGASVAQSQPTAGDIISKMLARYSGVDTLTGEIKQVIEGRYSSGAVSEETDTQIQYEKPSKLYIRQQRFGNRDPHVWLVTSDGARFSYDFPKGPNFHPGVSNRLVEIVNGNDVAHIYGACVDSIGDRSAALGIAVSWGDELKRIVAQWATHTLKDDDGKKYRIEGEYRGSPVGPVSGTYYMLISHEGDLLEIGTRQLVAVPQAGIATDPGNSVVYTETWTVRLSPNAKPDEKLFTVVL